MGNRLNESGRDLKDVRRGKYRQRRVKAKQKRAFQKLQAQKAKDKSARPKPGTMTSDDIRRRRHRLADAVFIEVKDRFEGPMRPLRMSA